MRVHEINYTLYVLEFVGSDITLLILYDTFENLFHIQRFEIIKEIIKKVKICYSCKEKNKNSDSR